MRPRAWSEKTTGRIIIAAYTLECALLAAVIVGLNTALQTLI